MEEARKKPKRRRGRKMRKLGELSVKPSFLDTRLNEVFKAPDFKSILEKKYYLSRVEEKSSRERDFSLPPVVPQWVNFFLNGKPDKLKTKNNLSKSDNTSRISPNRSKSRLKSPGKSTMPRVLSTNIFSLRDLETDRKADKLNQTHNLYKNSTKEIIQEAVRRIQPSLPFSNRKHSSLASEQLSDLIITGHMASSNDIPVLNPVFKQTESFFKPESDIIEELPKYKSYKPAFHRYSIDPEIIPSCEKKLDLKDLSAYLSYSSKRPFKC